MEELELLRDLIKESEFTVTSLANKIGIARETLHKKLNGETEFTAREIVAISKALKLTKVMRDKIFLTKRVN